MSRGDYKIANESISSLPNANIETDKGNEVIAIGCGVKQFPDLSRKCRILLTLWHTMSGCSALVVWNVMLNVQINFNSVIWPGMLLSPVLLGANQAGGITTVAILIYLDKATMNQTLARVTNCVLYVALALMVVPVFYLPGNENIVKVKAFYGILCVAFGACYGACQAQSFAFSSLVPRNTNQAIYVSAGKGIAGVITWTTFTICYELVFEKDNLRHQQFTVLVMVIVAILCITVTFVLQELCFAMPLFQEKLKEARSIKGHEHETVDKREDLTGIDPYTAQFLPTVKRALYPAFRVGFILAVSILIFPATGPNAWPITNSEKNINMGVFQIGDLIFRFISVAGSWAVLSSRMTDLMLYGRMLFIVPFFIAPVYLRTTPVISHVAWLTFCTCVMVVTNGWGMTCCLIHCMRTARNKKEAETISNLQALFIVAGAGIGAVSSKLPLLGYSGTQ